jgi:hypothetical protein
MVFRINKLNVWVSALMCLSSLFVILTLILVNKDAAFRNSFESKEFNIIGTQKTNISTPPLLSNEAGGIASKFSIGDFSLPDSQLELSNEQSTTKSFKLGKLDIPTFEYNFRKPINFTNAIILAALSLASLMISLTSRISLFDTFLEINAPPFANKRKVFFNEIEGIIKEDKEFKLFNLRLPVPANYFLLTKSEGKIPLFLRRWEHYPRVLLLLDEKIKSTQ